MAYVNLTTPIGVVNKVKVDGIAVDPVALRVYARVGYFSTIDNTDYWIIPLHYNNQNIGGMLYGPTRYTVVLFGDDYTVYNSYINQGFSAQDAVLKVLLDRGVISGNLV